MQLDERLVNLLRVYDLMERESRKPMKDIQLWSVLSEMREVGEMMHERLYHLFRSQYPHERFIWGKAKKQKTLPDTMPRTPSRKEP